jgi:DNA-binding CsgD family transcriptional regulator
LEEETIALNAGLESLGLSPRESEVLGWVAQGKTNAEVAELCGMSVRTVQKHLEHIFQKLGVESRTAAARKALELSKRRY